MGRFLAFLAAVCVIGATTLQAAPTRVAEQKLEALRAQAKRKHWSFTIGYSEIMEYDLKQVTGYVPDPKAQADRMFLEPNLRDTLPAKFDWRQQANGLTPIKNQGNCGSCWAFGTVAVFESILKIRDGVTRILSEQQLVSCNNDGWSCGGGDFAHKYHINPGAALASDFPYKASDVSCKHNLKTDDKVESWAFVGSSSRSPSVDQIKRAIYTYGVVSATVAATGSFQGYSGGVYDACDGYEVNHIVALVGWDDSTGTWILRNSWGSDWGESGYMNIKYNCSQVADQAAFVTYKPSCTPQPIAYAGEDVTISRGQKARLGDMAVPGQTYSWSPADALDDPHSSSPLASPIQDTTYTVSATNGCGTASKSVTVKVSATR